MTLKRSIQFAFSTNCSAAAADESKPVISGIVTSSSAIDADQRDPARGAAGFSRSRWPEPAGRKRIGNQMARPQNRKSVH